MTQTNQVTWTKSSGRYKRNYSIPGRTFVERELWFYKLKLQVSHITCKIFQNEKLKPVFLPLYTGRGSLLIRTQCWYSSFHDWPTWLIESWHDALSIWIDTMMKWDSLSYYHTRVAMTWRKWWVEEQRKHGQILSDDLSLHCRWMVLLNAKTSINYVCYKKEIAFRQHINKRMDFIKWDLL